ncbi:hypothetical protein HG530_011602 [Fusarium avenaceum]|nr:hypothetical protein HG530_011602 [Fusarium avenaceum]
MRWLLREAGKLWIKCQETLDTISIRECLMQNTGRWVPQDSREECLFGGTSIDKDSSQGGVSLHDPRPGTFQTCHRDVGVRQHLHLPYNVDCVPAVSHYDTEGLVSVDTGRDADTGGNQRNRVRNVTRRLQYLALECLGVGVHDKDFWNSSSENLWRIRLSHRQLSSYWELGCGDQDVQWAQGSLSASLVKNLSSFSINS